SGPADQADGLRQVPDHADRPLRPDRAAGPEQRGRLRGRAGRGDRAAGPVRGRGRGPVVRRRIPGGQRRQRPRRPELDQSVDTGQELRHVRPGRAVPGHPGRRAGPAGPGDRDPGQRRHRAALQHGQHGVLGGRPGQPAQPGDDAGARRHHRHRDSRRYRRRPEPAALPEGRGRRGGRDRAARRPAQPRGGGAGGTVMVKQPLLDLTGRHAVITGGGGGGGRGVAEIFPAAGARISLLDLSGPGTEKVVAEVTEAGGSAAGRACDVSDPEQVAEAFAWAETTFGLPDILVNNAGINKRGPSLEITGAEWAQTFAVNLTGYFQCAQRFGRGLVDAGQPGSIVQVSSIGGVSSLGRGNFSYGVTKAGVNQLTRELAVVWGPHGIRVNAVAPCQIATEGLQKLSERPSEEGQLLDTFLRGIPLGRLVEPSEVAAAVAFLASEAASMITGVVLPVDGGNLALNAGGTIGD